MKYTADSELAAFLASERVATIAVPIDQAGTIHIATMNAYNTDDPLAFYFVTNSTSEKCRLLIQGKPVPAACTVGTTIGTPFVLQMRGHAELVEQSGLEDILEAYFKKRGDTNANVEGPNSVVMRFVPDWARYVDYRNGWDAHLLELP